VEVGTNSTNSSSCVLLQNQGFFQLLKRFQTFNATSELTHIANCSLTSTRCIQINAPSKQFLSFEFSQPNPIYIHTRRKYEYKSIYYHAFGIANHTNTATKFLTTISKRKTDLYYATFPKNVFVKQLLIFRVPEIR